MPLRVHARVVRAAVCVGVTVVSVSVGSIPARADDAIYLSNRHQYGSDGPFSPSSDSISGTAYSDDVSADFIPGDSAGKVHYTEFSLSRRCQRLDFVQGLDDSSAPDWQVQFEAFGDGARKYQATTGVGSAVPVSIDISKVLRLRLALTVVTASTQGPGEVCSDKQELPALGLPKSRPPQLLLPLSSTAERNPRSRDELRMQTVLPWHLKNSSSTRAHR